VVEDRTDNRGIQIDLELLLLVLCSRTSDHARCDRGISEGLLAVESSLLLELEDVIGLDFAGAEMTIRQDKANDSPSIVIFINILDLYKKYFKLYQTRLSIRIMSKNESFKPTNIFVINIVVNRR